MIRRAIFWSFLFCYTFLCVGVVCIFIASVSPSDATKWFYTSLIDLLMTWKLGQKSRVPREAKCLVVLDLFHSPFSNIFCFSVGQIFETGRGFFFPRLLPVLVSAAVLVIMSFYWFESAKTSKRVGHEEASHPVLPWPSLESLQMYEVKMGSLEVLEYKVT